MHKMKKKIFAVIMTVLTVGAFFAPMQSVFAETLILGTPNQEYATGEKHRFQQDGKRYHSVTFTAPDGTTSWGFLQEMKMEGELAFCIEPLIITHSGISSYAPVDIASVLTPSTTQLLNKIAWYGYGYNNDKSLLNLYATEVAVWEACGVSVSNITPELRNKVNTIMDLVNNANAKLSFDSQTMKLHGYGKENKVTITDTSHQLTNWGNNSTQEKGHIKYEVHGNTIDIWAETAFTGKEKLTFRQGTNSVVIPDVNKPWEFKEMLAYRASGYQTICRMGDPYQANSSLNIEVDKGNLELTKINEVGDLLDGSIFNLKSETVGINYDNDHIVTGGKIKIDDLYVGEYTLTEIAAPDKHVITTKSYNIIINADETTERIVVNKLKPTGKIVINKALEEVEDVENTIIDTDITSVSGIEFQLRAKETIYDSVTLQQVYEADEIIATFITDETGKIEIDNLNMGTYELQEIKTVDGYVLDPTIHTIVFRQEDYVTKEYTYILDVTNTLTETSFSKQDKDTKEELAGTELQVVDIETNEVLHEWITDAKTYLVYGLTEGKEYILREKKAPTGYYVAEDMIFIAGTKEMIVMQDEAILTDIQVKKVDAETNEPILNKDFKFAIYLDPECTNLLTEVSADKEQGTATFVNIPFSTIYIKEIQAPLGYTLSNEIKEVVIDENLENIGKTYTFTYVNVPLPKTIHTGDATSVFSCILLGIGCIIVGYGVYRSSKRNKKDKKK